MVDNIINLIDSINELLNTNNNINICFINTNLNKNLNNNVVCNILSNNNLCEFIKKNFNINPKKINIKREYYYSLIRDINLNKHNVSIYINNFTFLNEIKIKNDISLLLYKNDIINESIESFPNLKNYDYTNIIETHEFKFKNLNIILENNCVYINISKSYDYDILKSILKYLLSYL
jgi:hypothetical protein